MNIISRVTKTSLFTTVTIALLATATPSYAGFFNNDAPASDWMVESTPVTAPKGYRVMCETQPALCAPDRADTNQVAVKVPASFTTGTPDSEMKQKRWEQLVEVNDNINWKISPATDKDMFGVSDVWSMPSRYGDCEDYAIAKKWELLRKGFAPEQLLYAVVKGRISAYHAVLVVRTQWGDYVLDNMTQEVLPWKETGYTWVIRQSTKNPSQWVRLQERAEQPPAYAQTADAQQSTSIFSLPTMRAD